MIYITVPNRGWIHRSVAASILSIAADGRYQKAIDYPALHPPYDNFLNQAAKLVRESPQYEWWLNIDDDNAPTKNPLDLIALGKEIFLLPTPIWPDKQKLQWNTVGQREDRGLQKITSGGSGCMLIHRSVLEHPELNKHPFLSLYSEEGVRLIGPDRMFCKRAREAGFDIWTHFDYPCNHEKERNLLEMMECPTREAAIAADNVAASSEYPMTGSLSCSSVPTC